MTLELATMWLKSTESYKAFDKARRESVRAALGAAVNAARESVAPGCGGDTICVDVTSKHLDAVCDAGLPVLKILKLVGAAQLMKIAAAWQAPTEEKK